MMKLFLILFILFINSCLFADKPEGVLPVELVYFYGEMQENSVILRWGTATEINNYGFFIERRDSTEIDTIGFVQGHGNSNSPKDYFFEDTTIAHNGTYYYRLNQIDNDGGSEYSPEDTVYVDFTTSIHNEEIMVDEFKLHQNYPNPFNSITSMQYAVGNMQFVSLKIYDVLGNEIATLVNEEKPSGEYSITFDASGLPSGIYLYKLSAGLPADGHGRQGFSSVKKMIYLK